MRPLSREWMQARNGKLSSLPQMSARNKNTICVSFTSLNGHRITLGASSVQSLMKKIIALDTDISFNVFDDIIDSRPKVVQEEKKNEHRATQQNFGF